MSRCLRPALFLDRDGVINVDYGYVYRQENFVFMDGIFDLVYTARKFGYLVIVVTNQAGIGRGYYSDKEFQKLTYWMCKQFVLKGTKIDSVYYCPFHPEHGRGRYRRNSINRKPAPGMLLQAEKDFSIDMAASIMVGDNMSDMEAGYKAGVGTLLYLGNRNEAGMGTAIQSLTSVLSHLKCNPLWVVERSAC